MGQWISLRSHLNTANTAIDILGGIVTNVYLFLSTNRTLYNLGWKTSPLLSISLGKRSGSSFSSGSIMLKLWRTVATNRKIRDFANVSPTQLRFPIPNTSNLKTKKIYVFIRSLSCRTISVTLEYHWLCAVTNGKMCEFIEELILNLLIRFFSIEFSGFL